MARTLHDFQMQSMSFSTWMWLANMSFLQPKALQLILRDFYRAMGQDGKRVVAASPWANMASRWQIQNSSTVVPCATPSISVDPGRTKVPRSHLHWCGATWSEKSGWCWDLWSSKFGLRWLQPSCIFMHSSCFWFLMVDAEWIMDAMACYGGHVISLGWLVFAIPPHWKLKNGLRSNPSCQFLCQLSCTLHQFWPAISHPRAIVSKHAATQLGPQIGACPQMEPRCSGLWSVYVNLKALWWNDVEWFDSDDCWLLKPRRKVIEPDQAFLVDAGCCEGVGCKGTMVRNQLLLHGDPMEKTREPANWWTWNVVFVFSFVFQFLFWSFFRPSESGAQVREADAITQQDQQVS